MARARPPPGVRNRATRTPDRGTAQGWFSQDPYPAFTTSTAGEAVCYPSTVDPGDAAANLAPGLTGLIAARLKTEVSADDMLAYIAALTAHPSYTRRFANDLKTPGIRVPLDCRSHALGPKVWRWPDSHLAAHLWRALCRPRNGPAEGGAGDPRGAEAQGGDNHPRRQRADAGKHPHTTRLPRSFTSARARSVPSHHASGSTKLLGHAHHPEVVRLPKAQAPQETDLAPRRRERARVAARVHHRNFFDLLNVLSLCVELESQQAALLDRVCAAPMITVADLEKAKVLPVPTSACKAPSPKGPDQLPLP